MSSDKDGGENPANVKERQLAGGFSWWSRPREAFTEDETLLVCGSAVVSRLRAAVRSELSYSCTAGEREEKALCGCRWSGEEVWSI